MVPRLAGAILGLLAFTITVIAGLYVQNPVTVTLSRSLLALVVFCIIGTVLGWSAQLVIAEHERNRESKIRERFHVAPESEEEEASTESVGGDKGAPLAT